MNKCACGCGELCKGQYVRGHNRRGVKLTEETRNKMSAAQSSRLNSPSPKHNRKIVFCACGCGESFPYKKYWKDGMPFIKEYIQGHNSKTEEHKNVLRGTIKKAYKVSHIKNTGKNCHFYRHGRYLYKIRDRWLVRVRSGHSEPWARIIMSDVIGRPLKQGEIVHHINGIKDDDRPENLMLFSSNAEHVQWHWNNDPDNFNQR